MAMKPSGGRPYVPPPVKFDTGNGKSQFSDGDNKVKKFTPPPPNPTRPAMGSNVPVKPDKSGGYHGDPPNNNDAPGHKKLPGKPLPMNVTGGSKSGKAGGQPQETE